MSTTDAVGDVARTVVSIILTQAADHEGSNCSCSIRWSSDSSISSGSKRTADDYPGREDAQKREPGEPEASLEFASDGMQVSEETGEASLVEEAVEYNDENEEHQDGGGDEKEDDNEDDASAIDLVEGPVV